MNAAKPAWRETCVCGEPHLKRFPNSSEQSAQRDRRTGYIKNHSRQLQTGLPNGFAPEHVPATSEVDGEVSRVRTGPVLSVMPSTALRTVRHQPANRRPAQARAQAIVTLLPACSCGVVVRGFRRIHRHRQHPPRAPTLCRPVRRNRECRCDSLERFKLNCGHNNLGQPQCFRLNCGLSAATLMVKML